MINVTQSIVLAVGWTLLAGFASAYVYDPGDFAVEVVEYVQGAGVQQDFISGELFNDPNAALGRPTLTTTGDGWYVPVQTDVPVVPIGPAFRHFEVVTIGRGGRLTVKFDHPVADDRNNPYGIDFIIFGNSMQSIRSGPAWQNGNPEDTVVGQATQSEPGIVSVSQDGIVWHTFTEGPYADAFAPTASYRWNSLAQAWSDELDPTRPVDPKLNVEGMTVAQMIDAYNGSAGGTGFDIAVLGLDWIQYVRIEDDPATTATTEIDAIADVSSCGDYKHPYPPGDINGDCRVDIIDLSILAQNWLVCTWGCP